MSLSKKLTWSSACSVGNLTIDDEHLKMVQVYNELFDIVENDRNNRKVLASILSKLTDFSLFHFKNEEKYMLNMNYPEIEEHKKLHKDYIYQVALFNTELLGANPPSPTEIIEFVRNWLENHIFIEDIKYEKYNKEKGLDINY